MMKKCLPESTSAESATEWRANLPLPRAQSAHAFDGAVGTLRHHWAGHSRAQLSPNPNRSDQDLTPESHWPDKQRNAFGMEAESHLRCRALPGPRRSQQTID